MLLRSFPHRRILFWGVALLLMIFLLSGVVLSAPDQIAEATARLQAQSDGTVHVDLNETTGLARWVSADQGVLTREFANRSLTAESAARAFMGSYGKLFGIADQANHLQTARVETDEAGLQHVRFSQTQNGVTVFGADLVVHLTANGTVNVVNGYTLSDSDAINTTPTLSEQSASQAAVAYVGLADGYASESSLVVFNPGLITGQPSATYLTYRVRVDSDTQPDQAQWVFIDANTGEVRFAHPAVTDSRNRQTYNLKHGTSYASATLVRSEGQAAVTTATNCTVADINNAHDYAGNTYDFYFNRFNRDSYDGAGAAIKSYVCYGTNYQNAFWDGSKMTYGNGFAAADDVVAHELSHAVTERTSNLTYSYQSGALNESFSDIFGESVDLTNNSGTDTAAVRWYLGEDIPGIGAIRDMMNPTRFGDPDSTSSSNMYCGTSDNGGVHTNSGVPNKAFALMVDGGSFNGYTITGIGLDQAVQIEYRANTRYLSSTAKFLDAYNALNQSCKDLYGAGSTTCANVLAALNATKMNGPVCGAGGATATPAGGTATPTRTPTTAPTATNTPNGVPTATRTPAPTPTQTPAPSTAIINGNFESGRLVGWGESSSHNYALVMAGTGQNSTWGAWLAGANSETSEISQNFTVPAKGGALNYAYRISSSDSCGYDYGYVKVNNTVLKTYNLCKTNVTTGFIATSVSLSAYAGQTVTIRFRATTDASLISSFYIDNVAFTAAALTIDVDPYASEGITTPEAKPDTETDEVEAKQQVFIPLVTK